MAKHSNGETPESLQKRIEHLRENSGEERQSTDGGPSLAYAITLFMSMGLSFAGSLVAAMMLGDYLVKRTGHQYWYFIGLTVGLASGVGVVWRLLQPLLKSNR